MGWRAEDLDSSVQVHYKEGGDSSLCFLLMEVPWALERASGGNQHPQITRAGSTVPLWETLICTDFSLR